MHHATDTAACRNGQQMSAKALKHRWQHEVQIALPRWRAVMRWAVADERTDTTIPDEDDVAFFSVQENTTADAESFDDRTQTSPGEAQTANGARVVRPRRQGSQ